MSLDANNTAHKELSYKDIIKLCEAHQIEFKNQNIGSLASEIRSAFFNKSHKRIKFTKQQRVQLHERDNKTCKVCLKGNTPEKRQYRPHQAAVRRGLQ